MTDRKKIIKSIESCLKRNGCDCIYFPMDDCKEEMMRDALKLLGEYHDFCRFVVKQMFDKWNECGECASAEIYLRQLMKLGYVHLEDDVYSEVEDGR